MKLTRVALTPLYISGLTLLLVAAVAAKPFQSAKGYTLTPPTGWQMEKSGVVGTDVLFHAPPLHGFSAMLNAVVDTAPPGATIDNALTHMNMVYPRIFKGYKKLIQGTTTVDGTKALVTVATYQAGKPLRPLRMQQVVALKNGQLYIFTGTCLAADYSQSSAALNAALKSIHWTK